MPVRPLRDCCLSGSDECWGKSTGKFQTASVIIGSSSSVFMHIRAPSTCEPNPETWHWSPCEGVQWWDSPSGSWCISSAQPQLDCGHSPGPAFPENQHQLEIQFLFITPMNDWDLCLTYFNNSTEFHIANGQLLMSFFGDNFLQHFLQTLSKFSLNKSSGSCAENRGNTSWTKLWHQKFYLWI